MSARFIECPHCGLPHIDSVGSCPFTGLEIGAKSPTYRPSNDAGINLLGKSFSGYHVQNLIGTGAMGAVYGATQIQSGRTVALKVLLPRIAVDSAAAARLVREAEAMSRIHHENVVQVHEAVTAPGGLPCVVMERLYGESLSTLLTRDAYLPLKHTLVLADQVLAGLTAAHAAGVVHRDIKPENVFLASTERGTRAKLVDFGISRRIGEAPLTEQGDIVGTPDYLAPEQATGEGVDHRVDIWAVGVLLYELLTGELPFSADTIPKIVRNILGANPPPPDGPLPIVSVVMRALEKNPDARYQSAREMREALMQVKPDLARAALPRVRVHNDHSETVEFADGKLETWS